MVSVPPISHDVLIKRASGEICSSVLTSVRCCDFPSSYTNSLSLFLRNYAVEKLVCDIDRLRTAAVEQKIVGCSTTFNQEESQLTITDLPTQKFQHGLRIGAGQPITLGHLALQHSSCRAIFKQSSLHHPSISRLI